MMATFVGGIVSGMLGQGQGVTAMAGYSPAQTWVSWNTVYYTTNATTVWQSWNDGYQTYGPGQTPTAQTPVYECTPEQAEAARAAVKRIEDARTRAKELLVEHLDPEQRESYEKHGLFIVETPRKNRYRLSSNHAPRKLSGDKDAVSYCIHTYGVPREDELLGFKLLLEANEEEFLRTANATALAA